MSYHTMAVVLFVEIQIAFVVSFVFAALES
jgi:hypothetical protein